MASVRLVRLQGFIAKVLFSVRSDSVVTVRNHSRHRERGNARPPVRSVLSIIALSLAVAGAAVSFTSSLSTCLVLCGSTGGAVTSLSVTRLGRFATKPWTQFATDPRFRLLPPLPTATSALTVALLFPPSEDPREGRYDGVFVRIDPKLDCAKAIRSLRAFFAQQGARATGVLPPPWDTGSRPVLDPGFGVESNAWEQSRSSSLTTASSSGKG